MCKDRTMASKVDDQKAGKYETQASGFEGAVA